MLNDRAQSQLTAYLLSILVHHDRQLRVIGPPRTRQEWGVGRIGDYLRAIGRAAIEGGDEEALWVLLRESVALLPSRREEALLRLIRFWAPLGGWLDDQNAPEPRRPPDADGRLLERLKMREEMKEA
jgi:hypothetical protein